MYSPYNLGLGEILTDLRHYLIIYSAIIQKEIFAFIKDAEGLTDCFLAFISDFSLYEANLGIFGGQVLLIHVEFIDEMDIRMFLFKHDDCGKGEERLITFDHQINL